MEFRKFSTYGWILIIFGFLGFIIFIIPLIVSVSDSEGPAQPGFILMFLGLGFLPIIFGIIFIVKYTIELDQAHRALLSYSGTKSTIPILAQDLGYSLEEMGTMLRVLRGRGSITYRMEEQGIINILSVKTGLIDRVLNSFSEPTRPATRTHASNGRTAPKFKNQSTNTHNSASISTTEQQGNQKSCSQCGELNPLDSLFCYSCGAKFK